MVKYLMNDKHRDIGEFVYTLNNRITKLEKRCLDLEDEIRKLLEENATLKRQLKEKTIK